MPATATAAFSPPGPSSTTRRPGHPVAAAASSFTPPQPTRRPLPGGVRTFATISASAGRRAVASSSCCKATKDPSSSSSSSSAGGDQVGDVGEQTWDEDVLRCETAVLVEFWAPWCGPCRLMHPVIAGLAKDYAGRLRCLRVNTDENQQVATRYGIRSIPTILVFKDGERKETVVGAVGDAALATTVDRLL